MRVGIAYDEIFKKHYTGKGHPENPARLEIALNALNDEEIYLFVNYLTPRPATKEEILWNHTEEHFEKIFRTQERDFSYLEVDTPVSRDSFKSALYAVGAQFTGIDAILSGEYKYVFALVRPPGHHAEREKAMGFCLFNNIALAAHYLIKKKNFKKILIVDWDVHHGNGTQNSFYFSKEVLYFSVHQYPHYPGTGKLSEVGEGEGEGYTVNVPLPPGCDDWDYFWIFEEILKPIAFEYRPEFILVSAGFDPYVEDSLGDMKLTERGFALMTYLLLEIQKETNAKGILFTLEGGYSSSGLRKGIYQVIRTLLIEETDYIKEIKKPSKKEVLREAKAFLKNFWHL